MMGEKTKRIWFYPSVLGLAELEDGQSSPKSKTNRRVAPIKKGQSMKNQLTLKKLMFRQGSFGSAMAAFLLLTASALPALADDGTVCSPGVIPPVVSTNPYGHTYAEWSAKWWQWSLEQSTSSLELISKPGAYDGQVRFLAGGLLQQSTGGAASLTNQLTISSGTPLFFTIISTWDDNSGCPFTSFTAD